MSTATPPKTPASVSCLLGTATVILVAFGLRAFRLEAQSLWWDEGYSIALSSKSLVEITTGTATDIHPPLYYYLLHFWMPLAGQSEFAVRFLSLIFGVLLVAVLFAFGRRLFGYRVGLLAAAMGTANPFWVIYSQEARMYTLEGLLGLISAYLLLLLLRHAGAFATSPPSALRDTILWPAYVFVTALALYADYFSVYVVAFENAFVIGWLIASATGRAAARSLLWRWLISQVAVTLLYLPWLGIGIWQVAGYGYGIITAPPFASQVAQLWHAFALGSAAEMDQATPYLVFVAALISLGILLSLRDRTAEGTLFVAAYLVVPFGAFLATMLLRPFFNPRYLLVGSPPYLLLLALGAAALWRRWRPLGVLAAAIVFAGGLWGTSNCLLDSTWAKDDARAVIAFLESEANPDDLVLWETPHPFDYYYRGTALARYIRTDLDNTPAELTELAQGRKRIFWVTWIHARTDPWKMVNFLLEKHGRKLEKRAFTGYVVECYAIDPNPTFALGEMRSLTVDFEGQLLLTGIDLGGDQGPSVPSGDYAWVSLRLRSTRQLRDDLKFFVHVRDERGHIVGQDDRVLANRRQVRTPYWQVGDETYCLALPRIAPGTPPGRYQVEVGAYVDGSRRRLGIVGGSGPLIVGEVQVRRPETPPSRESLAIDYPMEERFGEVELLGYNFQGKKADDLPSANAAQGERLPLLLYWRATAQPISDHGMVVRLEDDESRIYSAQPTLPGGSYPPSRWKAHEVVAQWLDFVVAPDTPAGRYRLTLASGQGHKIPLAWLTVQERERQFQVPPMQHQVQVTFGDAVELLGFDIADGSGRHLAAIGPGQYLSLTLYWRAKATTEKSYTVFTHLLDGENRIWGQRDSSPQGGASPTTSWVPGQVIADPYLMPTKPDIPAGVYELEVGLYDALTGQRLAVERGGDRIVLGTVEVRR